MPFLIPARDAPHPTRTAVIAPVPAVADLVEEHRLKLDASAGWGVPAHVTVLYPFVDPAAVVPDLLTRLAAATRLVSAFDCRFEQTRWFGEEVLWLQPEPPEPFRRLTTVIWQAFPDFPPYAGRYAEVIPHLTIADGSRGGLAARQAVEQAVRTGLPRPATIDRLLLIAGTQAVNSWRQLSEVLLAASP
jgi:hypothetical protein